MQVVKEVPVVKEVQVLVAASKSSSEGLVLPLVPPPPAPTLPPMPVIFCKGEGDVINSNPISGEALQQKRAQIIKDGQQKKSDPTQDRSISPREAMLKQIRERKVDPGSEKAIEQKIATNKEENNKRKEEEQPAWLKKILERRDVTMYSDSDNSD
ncbi:MAG: hypothetical protein K2X94_04605 [Amoebophilaceae bacterium]|nr:hypothetical protein [Amoebophilaceae bacterium]